MDLAAALRRKFREVIDRTTVGIAVDENIGALVVLSLSAPSRMSPKPSFDCIGQIGNPSGVGLSLLYSASMGVLLTLPTECRQNRSFLDIVRASSENTDNLRLFPMDAHCIATPPQGCNYDVRAGILR